MTAGENVFNPKVVAGIVAAGIAAFAAFILPFAYADDFRTGRDGRGHPLSGSAIGFSGIVKLIDLQGGGVKLIRNPVDLDSEDLVVVAIEARNDAAALGELLRTRGTRPTLLILPKWSAGRHPLREDWVQAAGPIYPAGVAATLKEAAKVEVHQYRLRGRGSANGRGELEGWVVPIGTSLQTVSGATLEPVLVAAGGRMVLAKVAERPLYILADPDLLNNRGLKDPARAKVGLALLAALSTTGARAIDFDLTLNGFGRKPGALKLAFEPPFLALTLSLFVAALLAGLHGAFRFGPALREERAVALGKAALVENSAGLFRLARREAAVGPAYAELIRESAAHAAGAGPSLQGEALDRYLDRVSPADAPFSALAGRAAGARDRFDLLAAARALFSWKKDLIK